jgi:hypothetical protein
MIVTVQQDRVNASGLTCAFTQDSWFMSHTPLAIYIDDGVQTIDITDPERDRGEWRSSDA